ncbi:MAG TPA: heavy-metal-associated domain-containing protein [Clostridiales bacterium]|nr:heavy-metal-associated domain-containing protein [Clostridiales bacterium]
MKKVLTIEGMSCKHCIDRVTKALNDINGVKSVKVKLKNGTATVKLDKEIDNDVLKNAVEDMGYKIVDIK